MRARLEAGLPNAVPRDEAARLSQILTTEPLKDGRKSLLKMFKEFFTDPHTAH
jgi:hypothetical protein